MYFSFSLFGIDPSWYVPIAQHAEELGFEAVWIGDHLIVPLSCDSPYPGAKSGVPPFAPETPISDPWVMIGFMAGATKRIKLGTAVFILPLRNPFATARTVATVQNASGGRVVLGIGNGWLREEFDVVGERFSNRGSRTDEILDVLERLWSGEPVEYHGKHYDFPLVQFGGAPKQRVPLVFGSYEQKALERVAARGDGWHSGTTQLDGAVRSRATIEGLRAAAGRSHLPFTYYVRLAPPVTAEKLHQYEDAGFEHFQMVSSDNGGATSLADFLAKLDSIADAVASAGYRLEH